jgi:UDP-glucose 4-epimerase
VKILVTGGAGYIGGTVTKLLLERGHSVVVYDNLCHARRSMVPPGATFVEGDVADSKRLEEIFSSDSFAGVMHFAALIEAGDSMRKPETYFGNNTAATLGLLQAMINKNLKKLVFSSTAAVYGEPVSTPILEDAALVPTNPYGESKLLVEQMLSWIHRVHGLRYASLLILDVALGRRQSIKIFGQDYPTPDGTCIRDYIHVQDLAEAHLLAFEGLDARDRMIYNLGNGVGFSVREVVESARRVTGHPIPVDEMPRRPGDPAVLIAGSAKIEKDLGWKPTYSQLDDIVRSAWEWHQQRYQNEPV